MNPDSPLVPDIIAVLASDRSGEFSLRDVFFKQFSEFFTNSFLRYGILYMYACMTLGTEALDESL